MSWEVVGVFINEQESCNGGVIVDYCVLIWVVYLSHNHARHSTMINDWFCAKEWWICFVGQLVIISLYGLHY